jgi:hypothetical protein
MTGKDVLGTGAGVGIAGGILVLLRWWMGPDEFFMRYSDIGWLCAITAIVTMLAPIRKR